MTFTQYDYVFLPHRLKELLGQDLNEETLSEMLHEEIGPMLDEATEECQELFSAYICSSFFFRSRNVSDQVSLPSPLCPDECREIELRCRDLWTDYRRTQIGQNASCSHTGMLLEPLPYCCMEGVKIQPPKSSNVVPQPTKSQNGVPEPTQAEPTRSGGPNTGVAVGVSMAMLVLLVVTALVSVGVWMIVRKFHQLKKTISG